MECSVRDTACIDTVDALQRALQICQRCGYRLYEIDAELILARAYLGLEDKARAKSLAQSAYDKANQMHYHQPKIESARLLESIKGVEGMEKGI